MKMRPHVILIGAVTLGLTALSAGVASAVSPLTSAKLPNLTVVDAVVAKYKGLPEFIPGGPAFNASAARGKTVWDIPGTSSVQDQRIQDNAYIAAMKLFGVKVNYYANQGQPTEWIQGMNAAIAGHADLILLPGAPDPRLLQPQLKRAKQAHIPVIVSHFYDESDPVPANVTALVRTPFNRAGKLMADYVISDSRGHANVLIITANDAAPSPGIVATEQAEYKKYCGPGCKVTVVNVIIRDWAKKVQTTTQAALLKDPTINYVVPNYDAMAQFIIPAIITAKKKGKVKVVSFNGSPFALTDIQNDNVMAMDVGENQVWTGWANADQSLRILTGNPPVKQEYTATRIFDKSNVLEAGKPAQIGKGTGDAYIKGYRKLWKLTK